MFVSLDVDKRLIMNVFAKKIFSISQTDNVGYHGIGAADNKVPMLYKGQILDYPALCFILFVIAPLLWSEKLIDIG